MQVDLKTNTCARVLACMYQYVIIPYGSNALVRVSTRFYIYFSYIAVD